MVVGGRSQFMCVRIFFLLLLNKQRGVAGPASPSSWQTREEAICVQLWAGTARGGSAGGRREAPQPGLDVAARDGKCLIKPQPVQSHRLLAAPP